MDAGIGMRRPASDGHREMYDRGLPPGFHPVPSARYSNVCSWPPIICPDEQDSRSTNAGEDNGGGAAHHTEERRVDGAEISDGRHCERLGGEGGNVSVKVQGSALRCAGVCSARAACGRVGGCLLMCARRQVGAHVC